MGKLFFQMPCLSESREIKSKEIYEYLFDKNENVHKRYLENTIQKFLFLNKKMLSFLGINVELNGIGKELTIKFKTEGYIGAIPVRMPYDGIAHKDFQIIPRFDNSDQIYSDLAQLLSKLNFSVTPEFLDSQNLTLPHQLRQPMYYEAIKYIELFESAQKQNWVKFDVKNNFHHFPKSNTNWAKYSQFSADPAKALIYPSTDSVLSINHQEWRKLTYVFDIAKSIIMQQNVPELIRNKYRNKIIALQKRNSLTKALTTNSIQIRASDPCVIKETKTQANILLQKETNSCVAWRIDMATLFERYIQYIVSKSLEGLNGNIVSNCKIQGKGQIPHWGLKYLEPDLLINYNSRVYMADAKYKAHCYAISQNSKILKETHRSDLHQLLAYCSFSPEKNKIGILFYPSESLSLKKCDYTEQFNSINNTVYILGVPFGLKGIDKSISEIRNFFVDIDI